MAAKRHKTRKLFVEHLEARWLLDAAPPVQFAGDINSDGMVNGLDMAFIASRWNQRAAANDSHGDRVINGMDIGAVAAHWGQMVPTATTPSPEPTGGQTNSSGGTGESIVPGSIVSRLLFYAGSPRYDTTGNPQTPLLYADDNAIAIDKQAYLPGSGPATFANISSYSRGINGIMVDISGSHPNITAADFSFAMGNDNTPGSWSAAPAPATTIVRRRAGADGSDRVEVTWANGAIQEKWLKVTVAANANTGLSVPDIFFFGSAVGASGASNTATLAETTIADEIGARNNFTSLLANIPITNAFDYNRDGTVSAADQLVARNNNAVSNAARFIDVPTLPVPQSFAITGPSGLVSTVSPTVSWQASANADSYTLSVSQNPDGSSPIQVYSNLTTTSQVLSPLVRGATYYAFAVARNNASATSTPANNTGYMFTLQPITQSFDITAPSGSVNTLTPTVSWLASAGADNYTLTISPNPDGSSPVQTYGNLATTSQVLAPLANGATYYAFVAANQISSGSSTPASNNGLAFTVQAPTQSGPGIHLDATDPSSVGTKEGAALFNAAAQQYLTEPDNSELDNTFNSASQLTIEFQAKQTTLGLDRTFLSRWDYGGLGTIAIATGTHAHQEGELSVWIASASGAIQSTIITQGAGLVASNVYDVAIVFDGTQAAEANRVAIYVNGVRETTTIEGGAIPATMATSTASFDVGRWNGLGRYLDGSLQNVNIWNMAKTQAQIRSLNGDSIPYAQMTIDQRAGLAQSFNMLEESGPRFDAVGGVQLQDPTGVAREQIVTSWTSSGTLPMTFTPSPNGFAPDYVAHSPLNGQAALKFNGLDQALKYASTALPDEASGDVFIAAQFIGGGDGLGFDTLFSSSSDTTAEDYFFFSVYNAANTPASEEGGAARIRLRFRDGTAQDDIRGSQTIVQPGVTYVLHYWGLGAGKGYGLTINGLDQSPFFATSPQNQPPQTYVVGSWFGDITNRTNLTIGDFERADGPQGWASAYISEISVIPGTHQQPTLSTADSLAIVDYLMAKYGATPLGNDG